MCNFNTYIGYNCYSCNGIENIIPHSYNKYRKILLLLTNNRCLSKGCSNKEKQYITIILIRYLQLACYQAGTPASLPRQTDLGLDLTITMMYLSGLFSFKIALL